MALEPNIYEDNGADELERFAVVALIAVFATGRIPARQLSGRR
jgi:hypothetical protein